MISRSVGWSSALVPDACRPAWRIVQRNSSRARGACRRRRFRCSCGGAAGTARNRSVGASSGAAASFSAYHGGRSAGSRPAGGCFHMAGSTPRAGRDRAFPAFLLGVDILPWQAVPAVWTSSALRRYGIRRGGRRRGGMRCDTLRRIPRWGLLVRLCLRRSTLLRAVSAGVGIGASGCLTKMGPSAAPGTTGPGASGTAGRRMGRPAAAGSSGGLPNGL